MEPFPAYTYNTTTTRYSPTSPSYNYYNPKQGSTICIENELKSVLYKHYILIFGGVQTSPSAPKSLLVYNIETQQWTKITPKGDSSMRTGFGYRICCIDQDKVLRFGIAAPKTQANPMNTMGPTGNQIFMAPGTYETYGVRDKETPYCEVLMLSEDKSKATSDNPEGLQAEWHEVKINNNQIPGLECAALNFAQNKLYLHGGRDCNFTNSAELYIMNLTTKNNQFAITDHTRYLPQSKDGTFMKPRHGHSSVVHRDHIYYYGGIDDTHYDMWTFNIRSLEWNEVKFRGLMNAPRAMSTARAVGDTMILFGGFSLNNHGFDNNNRELVTFNLRDHTWNKPDFEFQSNNLETICEIYQDTLIYGKPHNLSSDHSVLQGLLSHKSDKDESSFKGSDQKMFGENLYTDVTFNVEGQKITAHRAILATRCQHFNQMFLDKKDEIVFDVSEIKPNIFNGLLEYIYCGDVEGLSEDVAAELLKLADKCEVSGLREFCEEFLIRKLAVENVVSITNLADAYGAENLQKACLLFITENFAEVFKQQDIKKLASAPLFELFKKKLAK